jgi:O-antigen/teichoic acid export membrane protein
VGTFCLAENIAVDTALWVIAGSSAVGFAVGWGRERLAFRLHEATRVLRLNYAMARDFFLSGQLQWAGSQGVLMIAGSFLGVAASGGIRAAQNVVSPLNVLYQAMENVIPVKAAHEYMQNNIAGLVRYLGKVSRLGGSAILLACLMMSLFSEQLIQLLYGNEYVKYAELVIWQAGYMLLGFYLRQAIYFHRAMNSTSVLVFATLVAASSSIAVAFLLIPLWGERGLMIALVLSQCLGLWLAGREVYKVIQRCQ